MNFSVLISIICFWRKKEKVRRLNGPLSNNESVVLQTIKKNTVTMHGTQIARLSGIATSDVYSLLNSLEERGLIIRSTELHGNFRREVYRQSDI